MKCLKYQLINVKEKHTFMWRICQKLELRNYGIRRLHNKYKGVERLPLDFAHSPKFFPKADFQLFPPGNTDQTSNRGRELA